jgi:ubiquinone/menaquinone biosynthesis C-methylase UbiE
MTNFDPVAGIYRALEYLAFGRALEAVRFHYLAHLRDCRHVLILGEGDGRFLERLVALAPRATIRCIDSSAAMLARAADRLTPAARVRVAFECADVRAAEIPPAAYDAVVTMFVLDCLSPDEVTAVVMRLATGLQDQGVWLFADFSLPASGWRRLRARVWVGGLHAFFRWRTGLSVRELPPSEAILVEAGFRVVDRATWQHGLLTAALYARRAE